jgi:hypothetical protein
MPKDFAGNINNAIDRDSSSNEEFVNELVGN